MGEHGLDIKALALEVGFDDQAVLVPGDVEHDESFDPVRAAKIRFHFREIRVGAAADPFLPSAKGGLSIGEADPKRDEDGQRERIRPHVISLTT